MIKTLILTSLLFITQRVFSQSDSVFEKKLSDTSEIQNQLQASYSENTLSELDNEAQDASSLLQSARDVFVQFAGFQFGASGYMMRGNVSKDQRVMINGVNLENPETGSPLWSSWSGLNEVTRFVDYGFGNSASRSTFSGTGAFLNIDSKASSFRKGTRIGYTNANRAFTHRSNITHATGLMRNNLALVFSASIRQGSPYLRPGTYLNAGSFYFAIEKQIGRHAINFSAFTASTEQARSATATLECFQLANNNYYNSLWGYQNGKIRNTTVTNLQRPVFILNHTFKINTSEQLMIAGFSTFGQASMTGLNWHNAADPRPDYYRYLPAYYFSKGDSAGGNLRKSNWETDINTQQINWDQLIAANTNNLFTLPSQAGQGINTTETRARYIVENKIERVVNSGINIIYNKRIDRVFISAGACGSIYKNRKYKVIDDLLGATFWLDYDMFAQSAGADPSMIQNNIDAPDKKLVAHDKFGYDYTININKAEMWGMAEQSLKKFDVFISAKLSGNSVWRQGYMANGKFPTSSKGNSEKLNFINYGFRSGAVYKISGRNFLTGNTSIQTKMPETNNIFISVVTRNETVNDIKNEKIIATDLNYHVKFPSFKLRLTAYLTQIYDRAWQRLYYSDVYNTNINVVMKNINQVNRGFELGLEKSFGASHAIQLTFGCGQFIYNNRPILEAWQDNTSKPLYSERRVYLRNYNSSSSPQSVAGIGYRYSAGRSWFAGLYLNYFDKMFVTLNPDRRTEEALSTFFAEENELYEKIVQQEKLSAYSLLNFNAGKTIRLFKKYQLFINLSVNNILNNKKIIVSGREQMRWDYANIDKFANKYTYMPGINYMGIINFSF